MSPLWTPSLFENFKYVPCPCCKTLVRKAKVLVPSQTNKLHMVYKTFWLEYPQGDKHTCPRDKSPLIL
jgi:hypothetical protein